MLFTKQFFPYFLIFLVITAQAALFARPNTSISIYEDLEHYTQVLASLTFHVQELQEELDSNEPSSSNRIEFSDLNIATLWDRATSYLESSEDRASIETLKEASELYSQFSELHADSADEAKEWLESCRLNLTRLWLAAIAEEESEKVGLPFYQAVLRQKVQGDPNLERNPYLSNDAKKHMRPYLLPFKHPMRSFLDDLCLNQRITIDKETFEATGFHVFSTRPRSYISVASHPNMPGYLVKVYFDTVLQKKRKKESWEWLVLRCEGALKVQRVIRDKEIKHFTVANKWIYCLPPHPSPPRDSWHKRHFALLLVTDMDLAPDAVNHYAWRNYITEEHLNELYLIISRAKGSSYRPDNISYSNNGTFAFIDTEYPAQGPDFKKASAPI